MTSDASTLWSRTLRTLMEPTKKNGKAPLWQELVLLGLSCAASGLLMMWALDKVDPNGPAKKAAKQRKKDMAKQMGRKDLNINEYESMVAADVINPKKIYVTLDSIGGLDDIKKSMYNKVIAPMQRPDLFGASNLLKPTKGVLLFGPPGTGKTMLAKAIARESGANFINIRASSIQSKWFGDTSKLVTAVFTLAWKISPCIIFIDEVDAMLGRRTGQEHDAVTTMKTVFMQMWDGFMTQTGANVVVLAATNRPWDLDEAVLRRLPLAYEVGLPDANQRENILLKGVRGEFDARGAAFVDEKLAMNQEDPAHNGLRPLQRIAELTNGYSGSDLMELCKLAASIPIHEFMDEEMNSEDEDSSKRPRCMSYADMEEAVPASKPSFLHAHNYKMSQSRSSAAAAAPAAPAADSSAAVMQAMMMISEMMKKMNSAPSTSAPAPSPGGSNGAPSNGAPSNGDANGMD